MMVTVRWGKAWTEVGADDAGKPRKRDRGA